MSKLHQWINTGLLIAIAAGTGALWLHTRDKLGVQCLEPQEVARQYFKIDKPGFCVAVAPEYLDRD